VIQQSIRRPVAVSMAYLAIAILGVAAWRNIPIELLPDASLPRLTVFARWRGASPETVEAFLTSPMEAAIQQVQGVQRVVSWSEERDGAGESRIQVEFARETDMDFARLEMSERLSALEADLPGTVQGPFIERYVPEEFRDQDRAFLAYTVTGPHTLEALRRHVDDLIRPDVLQLDGVAEVVALGGRARLLEIELDERRIDALGLTAERVRALVADLELVREAGMIEDHGRLRSLAIRQRAGSAQDVLQLPIITDGGRLVRVADVAQVHDTYEDAAGHYRIDGQPAVAFEVYRAPRTNAVTVADGVKAHLASLSALHPPGVRLILDNDESETIRAQLTDLRYRALIAAIVVFAVLLAFLRSVRSAGIVFATIAFSILISLNLIYFGGLTLNVLTLMGLAMGFGLIVDNAIVVLENIYRRRHTGEEPTVAAHRGAQQVVLPILAATFTTLIVFIPFVYLQGELRVYYVPLAIVVGMALFASIFVAFTFVPSLSARLPPVASVSAATEAAPVYQRAYLALVRLTLRFPWLAVLVAAGAFYGSYRLFDTYVARGVLWRNWWAEQTYVDIDVRQPRGEELERTDELVRYFEARVSEMPEVERFVTRVSPQWASIRVTFPDSLENTMIPVAVKEQLVAFSLLFGGTEVRVTGYGPSFYGGGASPPNYSIEVLGYNYETVRTIAEDIGQRLRRFPRVRDVDVNSVGRWFQRDKATEFVLALDRGRLAMHDLSAREVVQQVRAAAGGDVGNDVMRIGGEELRYAVKLEGSRQLDVLDLQELLIPTAAGEDVRLTDVATLAERQVLSRVVREDQQYQRIVSYEFLGPTKLGDAVQETVIGATHLPNGYTIETRADWRWSVDEERQIYGVLAVSLALIIMVTAALFESIRQPFCVVLAVPMALVGVFLIFFYTGASFTREAYIGVIMMGGIVVNNAILLVDHINRVRHDEGLALRPAILKGTLERVRPILMTSTTTIFGLLPLVLFSEAADANIWNALGFALIGGLASSTIFVLTVTPALYLVFERGPEKRRLRALAAPA
jgi:HAE1 family hydrophobic/amphiphilic exporter-1